MVAQGDLLWTPSAERVEASELKRFMRWVEAEHGIAFSDYESLRRWSVEDIAGFWDAIWKFYGIKTSRPYTRALGKVDMPGTEWFEGARLNFTENVMRKSRGSAAAVRYAGEGQPLAELSWDALEDQVTRLAAVLRGFSVQPGDRVVAFMPNIPETIVAVLACAAIGAVWSCCSTDFGTRSVLDRFQQIEPTVFIAVDGYVYNGKPFDRAEEIRAIVDALPTLREVVVLRKLNPTGAMPVPQAHDFAALMAKAPATPLVYEQVPSDHPLWIVYSSGTTGLPKAIVHGHAGILAEIHKGGGLHSNLREGSVFFFYSTSGWIMWNITVGALLLGATAVIYDGHPSSPQIDVLWRVASEARATVFGASPTYVANMAKNGVVPKSFADFSALEGFLLTGSPVTPEAMQWLYENVKEDLWVTSQSGGTDICAGFVTGSVITPVYAGEIQVRALGVDVHAFNDHGESVIGEVGELVVTQPMPSMPLRFWNDKDDQRYLDSYFRDFPGYWRHGDFLEINARGGCFIQGRSDSTLNRYGVRIGTAEVYRTIERLEGIDDSLVVNLDLSGGRFFMPLFVKLSPGAKLDDDMLKRIKAALVEECSPRHVPDKVYAVNAIPYTLTGKKLEVPVRKILMGIDPAKAASRDAMQDPSALDYFIEFGRVHADYTP